MTERGPDLAVLQVWMQNAIMGCTGETGAGLGDVSEVIARSVRQTAEERLAIYQRAYWSRLVECLRGFFPATVQLLGEELFDKFAVEYVRANPSQSETLDDLADRFADFLEAGRSVVVDKAAVDEPACGGNVNGGGVTDGAVGGTIASETGDWSAAVVDVARLEWTMARVFDGPGSEGEPGGSAEEWERALAAGGEGVRLEVCPSVRLLALRSAATECVGAWKEQQPVELPAARPVWLVVWRRDYVVQVCEVDRVPWSLLERIAAGETLEGALGQVTATAGMDDEALFAERLGDWFREWVERGWLRGVAACAR